MKVLRITLDINEVQSQITIPIKVGDTNCKLYITLTEGGMPYKVHENTFGVFTGKKGDGNYLFNNCLVEDGVIRYDFTPQTVAAPGVLECEVRIYDEDGGTITTPRFTIVVDERVAKDSEVTSSSELTFLDDIATSETERIVNEQKRIEAFNNLGLNVEDNGDNYVLIKTDKDGSQEEFLIGKGKDYVITSADYKAIADKVVTDTLDSQAAEYFEGLDSQSSEYFGNLEEQSTDYFENIEERNKEFLEEATEFTSSASGNSITIESANAPLQSLKLYGKTTQDGTPTPTEPKELKSVGDSGSFEVGVYGKNLLEINEKVFTTVAGKTWVTNGITFTLNEDKSITANGTATALVQLRFSEVPFIPKGEYIISGYPTQVSGVEYYFRASTDSNWSIRVGEVKLTYTENVSAFGFLVIGNGITLNNLTFYPMLRKAEITDSTYEPCNKQTLTMPYTLRSDKSGIADEIDLVRGVRIQRAKEFNLRVADMNNSESFAGWTTVSGITDCVPQGASDNISALVNVGNTVGYNTVGTNRQVFLMQSIYGLTQTEWKTKYPDLVVKFVLPLITPIETPLSETELNAYRQLMTNSGNTTILSGADMEVDYYTPKGQAIGNIHSQVNKDYLKLQQAIISTGGNV